MPAIEITNSQSGTISGNVLSRYREYDIADMVITDCVDISVTGNLTEGSIIVTNTPHITLDGNKAEIVAVNTSPKAVITNTSVMATTDVGGTIALDASSGAIVSGNMLSGWDDGTATSAAIKLTGVMSKPVVRDNTYQGLPNGSAETVKDYGLIIEDDVTEARIGWNDFVEAGIPVLDDGIDTVALDAIELSFGLDVDPLIEGTGLQPYPFSGFGEVMAVRAVVGNAPQGYSITVNVRNNGGSVFDALGDVPEILAGANDSGLVKTGMDTALVDGDILTVDVITVGSTYAGAYLTVIVYVRPDGVA